MKTYQIWIEGYAATGNISGADYMGTVKAKSFRLACLKWSRESPMRLKFFDAKTLTYWGCKMYDNEVDARQNFG